MASRAESIGLSRAPHLSGVVRSALTDFYFNSGRLVLANLIWGAGAVVVLAIGLVWPLGALALSPLLVVPTAATFRLAARIVRDDADAPTGDRPTPSPRASAGPILLLGLAFVVVTVVLGSNLVAGFTGGAPVSWLIGTFAAWGLVGLWWIAIVAWPLIVDPRRADRPISERLRLAGLLVLVHPARFAGLGTLVAIIAIVSAILTVALLTTSLAFIALLACRQVYPVADALEARMAGGRS